MSDRPEVTAVEVPHPVALGIASVRRLILTDEYPTVGLGCDEALLPAGLEGEASDHAVGRVELQEVGVSKRILARRLRWPPCWQPSTAAMPARSNTAASKLQPRSARISFHPRLDEACPPATIASRAGRVPVQNAPLAGTPLGLITGAYANTSSAPFGLHETGPRPVHRDRFAPITTGDR